MSISERCRSKLRALESSLRDDHNNPDSVTRLASSDIFLYNDKKPTPLEELELLNTFANYFPCDDDSKSKLFYELFPMEKEVAENHLRFLIKLSSLALCIGLPVILELSAVWMKVRTAQLYASALPPASLHSIYKMLVSFVTGITSDMLSIPGLPGSTYPANGYLTDGDSPEHPLFNLHHTSALFAEAYLSAVVLIYGSSPTFISSFSSAQPLCPIGPPPAPIVTCLVNWLQASRIPPKSHHHSNSNHPSTWVSLDWSFLLRRFKSCFQTHGYADQLLSCCPPTPVCLAWWTIFIPLNCFQVLPVTKSDNQTREHKLLYSALGELHHELLLWVEVQNLCCLDTSGSPGTSVGHRHGSGSNTSTGSGSNTGPHTFANWSLSCFRKQQPTKDYIYLELLIQQVAERCLKPVDCQNFPGNKTESSVRQTVLDSRPELAITRVIEFLHLAWVNGRLRNLTADEFSRLLSPLAEHKLVQLLLARLKR